MDGSCKFYLLGAVLEQADVYGTYRPLYFLRRSTLPNKSSWSIAELEVGILTFRPYFFGIPFKIMTDHQPLLSLTTQGDEKMARVHRWLDSL
ncbi:unnamed protein product, partial [Discosporangium mesarthrocarpum]